MGDPQQPGRSQPKEKRKALFRHAQIHGERTKPRRRHQTVAELIISKAHRGISVDRGLVDGKDEVTTSTEAAKLLGDGHRVGWFPNVPLDVFRGEPRELIARFASAFDIGEPYYRDSFEALLRLVIGAPGGPPRNAEELLERLDRSWLRARWAKDPSALTLLKSLSSNAWDGSVMRLHGLMWALRGADDGTAPWAWEDVDHALITLPTSTDPTTARVIGRLIFVDFLQYVLSTRRSDPRPIVLALDELPAILGQDKVVGTLIAAALERLRSQNVQVVMATQSIAGLGEIWERVRGSGITIAAHGTDDAELVAELAGTRLQWEHSITHVGGIATDGSSAREQHTFRVAPNLLRTLPVGEVVLIHSRQRDVDHVIVVPCR